MSVRMLAACLRNGMHRVTPIEEMPQSEMSDWVRQELKRRQAIADKETAKANARNAIQAKAEGYKE